ncbi:MAG: hypothetical protein K1X89_07605 [Myxococcaceae bacterium]|nr:hypothetical protein [Myxococcaceae bacterium]
MLLMSLLALALGGEFDAPPPDEPGPSGFLLGPTVTADGVFEVGNGGPGAGGSIRAGVRAGFTADFGAALTVGYERAVEGGGGHHRLSLSLRGELFDRFPGPGSVLLVRWAVYAHAGPLLSLDDDLFPGSGGGVRGGLGFQAVDVTLPIHLELGLQHQWLQSGQRTSFVLMLGLGF